MNSTTELHQRIASGAIFGAVVLALTIWSFWSFAAMCAVAFVILMKEWWGLTKHRSRWWLLVGLVYVGAGIVSLLYLRWLQIENYGYHYLFYLFAIVWSGDVAAYFIGRKFGKHKIAPSISPGKSWEGLAASMTMGATLSIAINYRNTLVEGGHAMAIQYLVMAVLGATLGIVGLAGDLFESSLKRRAGVKDSGTLIPGHGGLFDRVDALLPCAILLALLLIWFQMSFRLSW